VRWENMEKNAEKREVAGEDSRRGNDRT